MSLSQKCVIRLLQLSSVHVLATPRQLTLGFYQTLVAVNICIALSNKSHAAGRLYQLHRLCNVVSAILYEGTSLKNRSIL